MVNSNGKCLGECLADYRNQCYDTLTDILYDNF